MRQLNWNPTRGEHWQILATVLRLAPKTFPSRDESVSLDGLLVIGKVARHKYLIPGHLLPEADSRHAKPLRTIVRRDVHRATLSVCASCVWCRVLESFCYRYFAAAAVAMQPRLVVVAAGAL